MIIDRDNGHYQPQFSGMPRFSSDSGLAPENAGYTLPQGGQLVANTAAQSGTSGNQGRYDFTVTASDGMATAHRQIRLQVENTNQAPVLLPMPMQLPRTPQ